MDSDQLKRKISWGRLKDFVRKPPSPSFVQKHFSQSFKRASTALFKLEAQDGVQHETSIVAFTAKEILRKASEIDVARSAWAGTKRVTDEEFEARFFTREVIGEGSFGVVNRVIRNSDGAELAAKTVSNSGTVSDWAEALEEARMWSEISSPYHPSILPLIEVLEVKDCRLHLITELMPCEVLGDRIFDVIMSEQACRLIMVQILSAIAHLHLVHTTAHRDVKPDNVLCQQPDPTMVGCLKLGDFGCCKKFKQGIRSREFADAVGTIDYASPELAAGFAAPVDGKLPPCQYGPSADVWALGCIAYEMFHGITPYYVRGDSEEEAVERIQTQPLTFPETSFAHLSATCLDFLKGVLSAEPSDRLTVDAALAHPWLQPVRDEAARVQMTKSVSQQSIAERRAERTNELLRGAGQKIVAMNRIKQAARTEAEEGEVAADLAAQPSNATPAPSTPFSRASSPLRSAPPDTTSQPAPKTSKLTKQGKSQADARAEEGKSRVRVVKASDGSFRAKSSLKGSRDARGGGGGASKRSIKGSGGAKPAKLLRVPSTVKMSSSEGEASNRNVLKGGVLQLAGKQPPPVRTPSDEEDDTEEVDPIVHYAHIYSPEASKTKAKLQAQLEC